ncbi:MAG: HPr family phosphocarrier protein [Defluviitaleaceae bacterium]|nr:HPr family phosphocarrier protein [Defluviitaleaceae bacterium]
MIQKSFAVNNSLEARDVALFVQMASRFRCNINLNIGDKTVNAKSIMGLVSLGILEGQAITLIADGADAEQAIVELYSFMTI